MRAGLSVEEARRRAVLALGGIEQTKEQYRDRRGLPLLESGLRDVRYGLRTLIKSPGFALAGVDHSGSGHRRQRRKFHAGQRRRPSAAPLRDADRIMRLWHTPPPSLFTDPRFSLSPANFIDWEEQSRSFEAMAIYRGGRRTMTGQGEPDGILTLRASASIFPILSLSPVLGRPFTR